MALTSYSTLKTAIENWLGRPGDVLLAVDDYIDLTEADVNDILRTQAQETTASITVNAETVAVPAGVLEVKRFSLASTPIQTLEIITNYGAIDANPLAQTGTPRKYALEAGNFRFWPPPDTSYSGTLVYVAGLTALSSGAPSNWLLVRAPDVYLYGALAHSAPHIGDDERVALWRQMYMAGLERLRVADWNNRLGSQPRTLPRRAY